MDGLRVAKVERVVLEGTSRNPPHSRIWVTGTLHLTPHHLFFSPDPVANAAGTDGEASPAVESPGPTTAATAETGEIWIPYPTVNVLQRLPQSASGKYPLLVGTKTFDTYTLLFEKWGEGGAEDVWQSVRDCAVTQSVEQLYAFFYSLPKASPVASTSALAPTSPDKPNKPPAASVSNPLLALSSSPETPAPIAVASPGGAASAPPPSGWATFNPRTEFARQGVGSRTRAWRFTDVNRDYAFCPTYPGKLVVPSRISDSVLLYAAKYRSKARIPALTYLHWANQASITRSSQPMVGIKGARSPQDERLVECIFTTHKSPESGSGQLTPSASSSNLTPSALTVSPGVPPVYGATPTNLIIDARPTTNAMANVAKGAGTENMDHYPWGEKAYLGIDNIHVMRNSLRTIVETLAEANAGSMPVDRERLRKSGWLRHLTAILDGSLMIIKNVHINSSHVLIHCSDGWDRTSQLSAIAQLCLDPYYRTMEGFKVLVEKDWLAFGHMFLQRSGHLSSAKLFTATPDNIDGIDDESDDDFGLAVKGAQAFFASMSKQFTSSSHLKEISPVFHQFLDCVRQIQRQFPDRFEFNEDYLIDMHYHLYACQFGTFMFDNERQRRMGLTGKPYVDRTVSAWEWFDLPAQKSRYLNPEYNSKLDDRTSGARDGDMGVLLPDPRDVRFWHRLFKRSDEDMNAPVPFRDAQILDTLTSAQAGAESLRASTPSPAPGGTGALSESTATAPAPSLPPAPARPEIPRSSSGQGFARLGGRQWNWGGISTGALSAFNQLKTGASGAISQLRERTDDEYGGANTGAGTGAGYEPGTGIGEGRAAASAAAEGRGTTVSGPPLEANPWGDPPGASRKPAAPPAPASAGDIPLTPRAVANGAEAEPSRKPQPARSSTADLAANPWSDAGAKSSLAELTLNDARPTERARVTGVNKSRPPEPPVAAPKQDAIDKAEMEAALGGSKAWDPLGAT